MKTGDFCLFWQEFAASTYVRSTCIRLEHVRTKRLYMLAFNVTCTGYDFYSASSCCHAAPASYINLKYL